MKILHIIDSGGLYGAEVVLLNLVAEQIKLGLDTTIASIGEKNIDEKPLETEAIKRGFKITKFRMIPGPNVASALEVLRFAQKEGFDLLHSHGYKGNVQFGLMPKKLRKIPLVATLHGWTSTKGLTKNRVYEWLDSISHRFIDAVVLVNKAMMSNPGFKNRNGTNLHVVNNGIPISDNQFDNLTIQQLDQSPTQFIDSTNQPFDKEIVDFCSQGFTIGSIGRLSPEKGYRYLIEGLGLLLDEGIDARLVIVGKGYDRNQLVRLIERLNLHNRVMLPGYRDNAKNYLPFFNVFAISSLTEGLPITLLEGMQAKTPIVATNVGGIPEVLERGRAGLLVQPCNPDALAEAISCIHRDGQFATELTNTAYQRVTTHYSSKAMALGYLDVYNGLIHNAQAA